jgi:hypothetical protein
LCFLGCGDRDSFNLEWFYYYYYYYVSMWFCDVGWSFGVLCVLV